MKYIRKMIFWVVALSTLTTFSQTEFKAIYEKVYPESKVTFEMVLIYKDGISKYISHIEKQSVTLDNKQFDYSFLHLEQYYRLSDKMCYQYRILPDEKTAVVSEWKNDVKWKILDERKKIGNYNVQKAVSNFLTDEGFELGEVVAWFTTEIPISSGPLRNVGLPGLVLKVEYTKFYSSIKLKSIDFTPQEKIVINKNGVPVEKDKIIKPFTINKRWLKKQWKIFTKNKK